MCAARPISIMCALTKTLRRKRSTDLAFWRVAQIVRVTVVSAMSRVSVHVSVSVSQDLSESWTLHVRSVWRG